MPPQPRTTTTRPPCTHHTSTIHPPYTKTRTLSLALALTLTLALALGPSSVRAIGEHVKKALSSEETVTASCKAYIG